jgi:Family of unknown function (DUF5335)
MARTIEIPRENWSSYFDDLGRRASAYPVRIEVENRELGAQEMARKLPLVGIELERKGSERGDIEVTVGDAGEQLLHHIDNPRRVFLRMDESGNIDCIDIEDEANGKTFIFFERYPGLPATTGQGAGYEEPAPGP